MEYNSLVLAYIGDAIYEVLVRKYLIDKNFVKVNDLQKHALNYVSAKNQALFLKELLDNNSIGHKFTSDEKDLLIISIMVHDGLKHGMVEEKYTRFDHPLLAANFVYENREKAGISEDEALFLKEVISSHMGPWTKDYDGNEVLPYPKNKYQNFVHRCDYLASRKGLLVPFDSNNNIIL